jgi:hypothetical protein
VTYFRVLQKMRCRSHYAAHINLKYYVFLFFILNFTLHTTRFQFRRFSSDVRTIVCPLTAPSNFSLNCYFICELYPRIDWIINRPCCAGVIHTGALSDAEFHGGMTRHLLNVLQLSLNNFSTDCWIVNSNNIDLSQPF